MKTNIWFGSVCLFIPTAWAQTQLPVEEGVAATLVVSVTRDLPQKSMDTPASIDVVDKAVLQEGRLQVNLSESLTRVPGLVVNNRQNYAQDLQISSRGYGARAAFGVRGIRLYADGIPATMPDGQGQVSHFDLSAASRIEVLRGPFSALYGNASGGVISIFTEDGGATTEVESSYAKGSDGTTRTGLKASGTAGNMQYHLSTAQFITSGWRDHSAARRDNANGKFKFNVSDDTKVSLVLNSVHMPDVQDPLGLTLAQMQSNPRQAGGSYLQVAGAVPVNALTYNTRKSIEQNQIGAVLDQRIDGNNSIKLTSYVGTRATEQFQAIAAAATQSGGVVDLHRSYQGLDARWMHKTQLVGRPFTFTTGLSFDTLKEDRKGLQNFVGTSLGVEGLLKRDETNKARSYDQYAQAEWLFDDNWRVLAGLRHSKVSITSDARLPLPAAQTEASYQSTNPMLGLLYHASEHVSLYASAGRGFETPTLNELAYKSTNTTVNGLNFGLKPAQSRQWELGTKVQLDSRWRINTAYFQSRTSNEIVVQSNSNGRVVYQNAGNTKRDGWETALSGQLGDAWSASLAATALRAIYSDAFASNGTTVASGNSLPSIPRFTVYGELKWRHQPLGLETAIEWRRSSRMFVNDANSEAAEGYAVANLRVSFTQKTAGWRLREFVRIDNVTNRSYAGSVIVNDSNSRFYEPAPGRTWLVGVSGTYSF